MPVPHAGRIVAALLVAIGVADVPVVRAQTRSTVAGTIRDAAGAALADVTVTLEPADVPGGVQATTTNVRGAYRFLELAPGAYDLTASLPGMQTLKRTDLRLPVGTTFTIDLTLGAATRPGVVTMNGPGPMVDVTTAAATTKLATEELENLPISGLALIQLVPGVTPSSAFGSALDTDQFKVDGGPVTLTLRGGSPSAALHTYWMKEALIGGLGVDAEHGEFGGVITSVAIRSGTNRPSGILEYRTTRSSWVGDNTGGLPERLRGQFSPEQVVSRWAGDAQAGGPIARDRLFFFTGVQYSRNTVVQPGRIGNVPLDRRAPGALTRLSWVAARNVNVDGLIQADRTRVQGGRVRAALPETASDAKTRVRSWNVHANWSLGPQTLLEFGNANIDFEEESIPGNRRAGPPPRNDRITRIASGNAGMFADQSGSRNITGASLTRSADGVAGRSHAITLGFELERTTYRQVSGFPGGRSFQDAAGVPEFVTLWAGDVVEGTGTRTTFYAQDVWNATERVSIHPGVRLSVNRGSVPDKGTVFKTRPVSLRLGAAWDLAADHKTVVRAAYGRLHEGLYTPVFDFMNTSGLTPRITARVLGPDTFQETNRSRPDNVALDPDLAHAYVDQFLVGVERELFADSSITVQYVRRDFDRIWAMIDTGSQYAPVQRRDPGPDGQVGTADDGGLVTVFNLLNPGQASLVLTTPDDAYRRYDAVQAIGQKRFARNWQLLAAYTWSKTRGTVNVGNGENRASGADTGRTGVFVSPNRRVNADGRSLPDFTHQVTVQGTYVVSSWGGASVSAGYRYLSGGAWGRVATITGLNQGNVLNFRIEPRGTRRVDAGSSLDVRVEKTFRLAGSGPTLGIYADLFNLMNKGVPLAGTVFDQSGATFGEPTQWTAPRTVQLAARLRF